MKTIKLKSLRLENFKGVKSLKLDFNEKENFLHGKNGSGKTTVFDAFTFLLYGKNSQNEKTFEIKTLDKVTGKPIHNLSHEVEGVFDINGSELVLKVCYKEKWTKKRGSETSELTGHTTDYFINDVPATLSEYKLKIDSILNEESFKMVSNPLFFNQTLEWKKRRVVLSKLAGDIEDIEVTETLSESNKHLVNTLLLSEEKTLEDFKKEYSAKRKKVKEELDQLPSRIDEVNRNIIEVDFTEIESKIESKKQELNKLQDAILNKNKSVDLEIEKINDIKKLKFEKEQKLDEIINENLSKSKSKTQEIDLQIEDVNNEKEKINKSNQYFENQISVYDLNKIQINSQIESLTNENKSLREKWVEINKDTFEFALNECMCPTCEQALPVDKIESKKESLEQNFLKYKKERLAKISEKGESNSAIIENLNKELNDINASIEKLRTDLESNKKRFTELVALSNDLKNKLNEIPTSNEDSQEIINLKSEIESIIIPTLSITNDNNELIEAKNNIESEIELLNKELFQKDHIEQQKTRLKELQDSQSILSQEIANFEKFEMAIDSFNNSKIKMIEERVNQNFEFVRFKMFEEQLNGGVAEICEAVVEGVPFSSLNTAMKINAGLDTIKVLQLMNEIESPVWIDNRESITNLIELPMQIINLVVDKECEKIQVK